MLLTHNEFLLRLKKLCISYDIVNDELKQCYIVFNIDKSVLLTRDKNLSDTLGEKLKYNCWKLECITDMICKVTYSPVNILQLDRAIKLLKNSKEDIIKDNLCCEIPLIKESITTVKPHGTLSKITDAADYVPLIKKEPIDYIVDPFETRINFNNTTTGRFIMNDNAKEEFKEGVENLVRISVYGEKYLINPTEAKSREVIAIAEKCTVSLNRLQKRIEELEQAASSAGLANAPSNVIANLRSKMEVYTNIFNTISTFTVVD